MASYTEEPHTPKKFKVKTSCSGLGTVTNILRPRLMSWLTILQRLQLHVVN